MTTPRSSGIMGIALCFILIGLPSCFLFSGSKTDETGLARGDMTSYEVATTLWEAGRIDEALQVYHEVIAADSSSLAAARSINALADIYISRHQYDSALEMYTLLRRFPTFENPEALEKKIQFVQTAQRVLSERETVARDEGVIK